MKKAPSSSLSKKDKGRKVVLAELIGATDLKHPLFERGASLNPFVIVTHRSEKKESILLRTKRRKQTNNPIWCIEHRCLFLLHVTNDMLRSDELQFDVRDKDLSDPLACTLIGSQRLSMREILNACEEKMEERIELKLQKVLPKSKKSVRFSNPITKHTPDSKKQNDSVEAPDEDDQSNKLAVRFRFATSHDLEFMNEFDRINRKGDFMSLLRDNPNANFTSVWNDATKSLNAPKSFEMGFHNPTRSALVTEKSQLEGVNGVMNMVTGLYKWKQSKGNDGIIRQRVQPGPDPDRVKATTFLSDDEMRKEMLAPSTNWTECGIETKGTLGTVYLEILGCIGLPNMDAGGALGNKTDSFVCTVFEENMVQTDVINDRLSPMWMPWTQRAFSFHMKHPFSQLFISVCDFDLGPSSYDLIGRIAVNLNHFESNVLYTLTYKIHEAANVAETVVDRKEGLGTISIRLRKHIKDEKTFLMSTLKPAPRLHVNMRSSKTLPVANFSCYGKYNEEHYDIQLLRSYVNEMLELKRFLVYSIKDSLNSLILWRGQVNVGGVYLPLHSAIAFFGGTFLIERPHLLPGTFFLTVAWILLASLTDRCQHPSPWRRTNGFLYYLCILRTGKAPENATVIHPNENEREAEQFEENWSHRIKTDYDAAWKAWELQLKMDRIGNEDLNTEEKKSTADPLALAYESLKPRLFPIQKRLKGYCETLRQIKAVTTWEEGILTFWVTLSCLTIGIVLLILPTVFLLHWACRLFIWICLGPWFRICHDLFAEGNNNPVELYSDDDREKHKDGIFDDIDETFKKKEREARLKGEEALKMKSMRMFRFGHYIAKVPRMNLARHYDCPLPESEASHLSLESEHSIPPLEFEFRKTNKVLSQNLKGKMIPLAENEEGEEMEVEKEVKKGKQSSSTQKDLGSHKKTVQRSKSEESTETIEMQLDGGRDETMQPLLKTDASGTGMNLTQNIKPISDDIQIFLSFEDDHELEKKYFPSSIQDETRLDDAVYPDKEHTFCEIRESPVHAVQITQNLSNGTDADFDRDLDQEEEGVEIIALAGELEEMATEAECARIRVQPVSPQGSQYSDAESASVSSPLKTTEHVYVAFCS